MRGKILLCMLVVVAALGLAYCQKGDHTKAPKHIRVKILMQQDRSCKQVDAGSGSNADTPKLSRGNKDTIVWEQGIIAGSGPAPLIVTFPQDKTGTPFIDNAGNPKYDFKTGDDSGPPAPSAKYGTYLYKSVQVGNFFCTNPGDPGVIIDK